MNQEEIIDDLAKRIRAMQLKARGGVEAEKPAARLRRGFHAKGTGVRAIFQVRSDLPQHLQIGLFQPDRKYEGLVRFSNARSQVLGDLNKDQRGLAIRLKTIEGAMLITDDHSEIQDFLMTNTPTTFARNPLQLIEVGEILLDGIGLAFARLWKRYGFKEAVRILGVFLQPIVSFSPLQSNQYWSRTSYQFGRYAIRFLVRPSEGTRASSSNQKSPGVLRAILRGGPQREHYLREKLMESLREGDLRFDFCIQLFVDEKTTPIEDAYVEWKESVSPPSAIATLIIPKQGWDPELQEDMESMAFSPWHTSEYTPLGLMNLARKKVYEASAEQRGVGSRPGERRGNQDS